MKKYDIVILTDRRYLKAVKGDSYSENIVLEDHLVKKAFEERGLKVTRKAWDDSSFDWNNTNAALFRTTWDYFHRFDEFSTWFEKASQQTIVINSKEIIYWNRDKHYLTDLSEKGIRIPPTLFIETGSKETLQSLVNETDWKEFILKPAISGAARHTYRFLKKDAKGFEEIFRNLIKEESMLLQEFQPSILRKGEISLVFFGNQFSHAVLKKGKEGDFRVQDDFGGTVHKYLPNEEEIEFATNTLIAVPYKPVYARVDIMRDNQNRLCLGELELIEPELWFRLYPDSVHILAEKTIEFLQVQKLF